MKQSPERRAPRTFKKALVGALAAVAFAGGAPNHFAGAENAEAKTPKTTVARVARKIEKTIHDGGTIQVDLNSIAIYEDRNYGGVKGKVETVIVPNPIIARVNGKTRMFEIDQSNVSSGDELFATVKAIPRNAKTMQNPTTDGTTQGYEGSSPNDPTGGSQFISFDDLSINLARDGGYDYDKRVIMASAERSDHKVFEELPIAAPFLFPRDLHS